MDLVEVVTMVTTLLHLLGEWLSDNFHQSLLSTYYYTIYSLPV